MAISLKRYVDITSGVGAGVNVGNRQLILRLFDDNALIPTNSQIDFTTPDDVISYFGANTPESERAEFYFGWVSKNITSPQTLSFARWNSVASAPQIFGAKGAQSLASWTSITAGSFSLTLAGVTNVLSGLNFSSAGSLAGVAAVVQAAIRAESGSGAMWTGATVTWDSVNARFDFTGGVTGAADVDVVAGTGGSDCAGQLGWLSATAILSDGAPLKSITQVLSTSAGADNNFGSFAFVAALDQAQIVEAATWNKSEGVMFMYSVPVTAANAVALQAAAATIGGLSPTLDPQVSGEFPEMAPTMILAATNYNAPNSTQNYMFQTFNLTASVLTDTDADTYDALGINYYGQTQTAGQLLQFYQRGTMWGLPTDPLDQNTYANEMWLSDALGAALMTLLLAENKVSANTMGQAQILSILQGVVNQALKNGTISVGKPLTSAQKVFINNATNDQNAWLQVYNIGYWLNVVFVPVTVNNVTEYEAVYTLIYSKDDVIRKIVGSDVLI